jgi:alkanesulfonate monooxygenase SsuD/methylene tetrahydromethanopterin reductase-like flavin-dependent oxidoreductase (luciferase family)
VTASTPTTVSTSTSASDLPTRSPSRAPVPAGPDRTPSFGIMTAPTNVAYDDILRVWREADALPQIEHAWLFDHLMPISGDLDGPAFEGWTLLSALAARTERLRLGLMVTSNRFRPPAVLAKIATTVDTVSGGRLEFGIGAGSRPDVDFARREYAAHGLPFHEAAHAVGSLAEACTVVRRLWTEDTPFDFDGTHHRLTGAFCSPKPVQRPYPPITVGGQATPTLRVAAAHADRWNMPGGTIERAVARSAVLDRLCAEIGRDPAEITRSLVLPFSYDRPQDTRDTVRAALDAGFTHIVLGLGAPYPPDAARHVTESVVAPLLAERSARSSGAG